MHTKFERLLSKSLTTLAVMTYYLVVHILAGSTGLQVISSKSIRPDLAGSTGLQVISSKWNRPDLADSTGLQVISSKSIRPALTGSTGLQVISSKWTRPDLAVSTGLQVISSKSIRPALISDLIIGSTLPGAWRYWVSDGTGWPGVSVLWRDEIASLTWNFYLSVTASAIVQADPSPRRTRYAAETLNNKQTNNSTPLAAAVWCQCPAALNLIQW